MTKSEFLSILANGLKELPDRKLAEIIFDYQENFISGFSEGKNEEDIINELGNPYDLIVHYKNLYLKNNYNKYTKDYYENDYNKYVKDYSDTSDKTTSTNINDTEQFSNDLISSSNISTDTKSSEESKSKNNDCKKETIDHINYSSNSNIRDTNNTSKKFFSKNFSINIRGVIKLALICFLFLLCIPIILSIGGLAFGIFAAIIAILIAAIAFSIALNIGSISVLLGKMGLVILGASNTPAFITEFPTASIIMFIIGSISLTLLFIMLTYYLLKFCLFYSIKLVKKIFGKEAN